MTIHKRAPRTYGRGPRSLCGRWGLTTHLWKNSDCSACLIKKPKAKK